MKRLQYIFMACVFLLTAAFTDTYAQSYSVPTQEVDLSQKSATELWDMANTAYANDNYIDAKKYYKEILGRDLHSADLYYNLGNVYHKRGEIGMSLLFFHKALKLSPADEDIRHNIEVATAKTKDNIEAIPTLFIIEWSHHLKAMFSSNMWAIWSLLFLVISLAALLLYLLTEQLNLRRIGFWITLVGGVCFITSTKYALDSRADILNPNEAIVMSGSLSVSSSPSNSSTELFILHEGTKVEILTDLDKWCEVKIADGKRGWVDSSKISKI